MKTQITTAKLISNFMLRNGNPITSMTIEDNGSKINIILENVANQEFEKPEDFNEYYESMKYYV